MQKEEEIVRNLIRLLPYWHYKVERPIKQTQKHVQISYESYYCLLALQMRGAMKMSVLATDLKMSRQHATQIIDKLYQHQLIERYSDDRDRRSIRIGISSSGEKFLAENRLDGSCLYAQMKQHMSEEELIRLVQATTTLVELLPKLQ